MTMVLYYRSVDRPPLWWPDDTWRPIDAAWVEVATTATDVCAQIHHEGRGRPCTETAPVVIALVLKMAEGLPGEATQQRMTDLGLPCPSGATILRYSRHGDILDALFTVADAMDTRDDGDDGPVTSGALPDFALMHSSMAPADPDGDWSRIIEQMCRAIAYDWNAWAQWLRDNHWTPPDTPSYDDAHDPLSGGAKAQSESLSVP